MSSSLLNHQSGVTNVTVNKMKKRIQAEKFLDTILNFKPLVSCKQPLTRFIDLFVASVDGLKSLHLENLSEYILYSIAMRKLDFKTRGDFEAIVIHENMIPSVGDLVEYIKKQRNYHQIVSECLQENSKKIANSNETIPSDSAPSRIVNGKKGFNNKTNEKLGNNSKILHAKKHNEKSKTSSYNNASIKPNSQGINSTNTNHTMSYKNLSHANKGFMSPSSKVDDKVCFVCGEDVHPLASCSVFNSSEPQICLNFIKKKKLCGNCFSSKHQAYTCPDKSNCNLCSSKHHFKLHLKYYRTNTKHSKDKPDEKTNKVDEIETSQPSASLCMDDSHLISSDKSSPTPNDKCCIAGEKNHNNSSPEPQT